MILLILKLGSFVHFLRSQKPELSSQNMDFFQMAFCDYSPSQLSTTPLLCFMRHSDFMFLYYYDGCYVNVKCLRGTEVKALKALRC